MDCGFARTSVMEHSVSLFLPLLVIEFLHKNEHWTTLEFMYFYDIHAYVYVDMHT